MKQGQKKRKKRTTAVLIGVAVILALALWLLWGNTALMTSHWTISGSRVPAGFDGFRIAQVSDLHNASFGEDNAALLRALEKSEPDCIVITGDFIDSRRTDVEVALDFAEKAVELAPVYYVSGNHESRVAEDYETLRTGLRELGVTVLEDAAVQLTRNGDTLTLLGLSDPSFARKAGEGGSDAEIVQEKLEGLMASVDGYSILLSHRPELFEVYADCGVDLVFSGHAHGGQVRIPFIGGVYAPNQGLFPQYDAGLYSEGETQMLLSRGLGNSLCPLRVNDRPELLVAELKAEET